MFIQIQAFKQMSFEPYHVLSIMIGVDGRKMNSSHPLPCLTVLRLKHWNGHSDSANTDITVNSKKVLSDAEL